VLKNDGSPASGASVVLVPDRLRRGRYSEYREESTDQYGRFVIKRVLPGDYHLYSWQTIDNVDYTVPEFLKPFEQKAQSVSVAENKKKSVKLLLLAAPEDSQ